jgi:hypothetical protein
MAALSIRTLLPVGDLRLLFWLRWRQFRDNAVYWLRLLGYDPREKALTQNFYLLYLLGIGSIWFFAMWAWFYDTASHLGSALDSATLYQLLTLLPYTVLAVQVFAMVMALRSTPLKLSFADMAYVAGTPIARSVPVLLGFVRQMITRSVVFGAIWALLTVMLLQAVHLAPDGWDSLRVIAMIVLVTTFTWAAAWLLGILRLVYPRVSRVPLLWLTPLLLVVVAYVAPDFVLWPGRAILLVMYHAAPGWLIPLMIAIAASLVIAFVWFGNRINMIQAVDESVVYARLAALGWMAWRMPDIQFRIRAQQSYINRTPWLKLPKAQGQAALVTKAAVSFLRHPSMLIVNLLWGAAMTYLVVLILVNQLPVQFWIGWVLVAGVAPPIGLLHAFRMDLQEPFLRQFLRLNGFEIFIADVVLPLAFLILGSSVVWATQGFPPELLSMGVVFIPLLAFLLALCGAFAVTRDRVLQSRLLATGLSFGLAIGAAAALQTPIAGLIVVVLAIMMLAGLLVQEA